MSVRGKDGDATRVRANKTGIDAKSFELRVFAGPDAGAVLVIEADAPSPVLVGHSPACALRLTDPEVSRRHASFEPKGTQLHVTDLGSTNGTFVNGVRVFGAALSGGECVQLGADAIRLTPLPAKHRAQISATSFGRVLGASDAMRRLYPVCERLALTRVATVIEGETGTGKELMAEALHVMGPRRGGPFIVFDCAAASVAEVDHALFGARDEPGVFELTHGGTLVLDEIAELPLEIQAKILRATDRGEIRRAFSPASVAVDTRIIATTQRDLDAEVEAGRFREDLYFRLAVARLEMPALRKRADDIPLLVRHFWTSLQGPGEPPAELVARLTQTAWPGNVRQLSNAVARQLALGDIEADRAAAPQHVADLFDEIIAQELPLPRARARAVDAFERRFVEHVLAKHGGNVTYAAQASGLALRSFQMLRARHAKRAGRS